MNAPLDQAALSRLANVSLDDKYTLDTGRAYMSGTQALVRLPMLQRLRDQQAGLNTAGFISGYRGSPLGALDMALWKAKQHLDDNSIVFQPGLNEDMAATAIWGSQQVSLYPDATHDGVFGMWYGKGPGVDRSMDVLKHANSAGTSPHGGVLVLAGDDHAAKSSTLAHQSEHDFQAAGIPVLYPSNVQEYLDYGLHGWAMSRYSGLWVAMKCVTDVVESTASVDIDPARARIVIPDDFALPEGGLGIRWPDPPLVQEARLIDYKWYAALAYTRANKLNRCLINSPQARFGIMTAGKAYLDTRQALADLGLDTDACKQIGIRLLKIGCVWPLNAQDTREFATGLDEILVIEEKRQILEYALKEELYNWRDDVRPRVYGKFDEKDSAGGEWSVPRSPWLLPAHKELSPAIIAQAIGQRLLKFNLPQDIRARITARLTIIDAKDRELAQPATPIERKPWFCSGCPHNTSTKVPEGSRALAGIGCHYMTIWMDRNTATFSHMGGEGAAWIGQHRFTREKHVFANIGDGTYFHSGILAIRAAIASGANITYKILYNDAVAMTGGQPVDGELKVPDIVAQVHAEGARKTVVVTDEPEKYKGVALVGNPTIYHRRDLDKVQRQLRDTEGTTVLIYDQTCATEKRRRRKRGTYPDPAKRVFINPAVCEGCGDCSVKSNCLSVEPLETPLGTKRKINQSSCNKDFSCVDGFCPSFVTAQGAQLRRPQPKAPAQANTIDLDALPAPEMSAATNLSGTNAIYGILVAGVGGTGVVTIGGLLGMAAHLENKGVTVLDMAGLAQKGGAVLSHIQIANNPDDIYATRVATGEAALLIGCDAIVASSAEVLPKLRQGVTHAAINNANSPTADLIHNPKWSFPQAATQQRLKTAVGDGCQFLNANRLAVQLIGDAIYANPIMLGFAWQKGWVPLALESLMRAIELNGVQIDNNKKAFAWGRAVAQYGVSVVAPEPDAPPSASTTLSALACMSTTSTVVNNDTEMQVNAASRGNPLDALIARNVDRLTSYQNKRYATRYLQAVETVRAREGQLFATKTKVTLHNDVPASPQDTLPLTHVVATNLAKLMAYKDEYEVARLFVDPSFINLLREQFEGEPGRDYTLNFHLAPPLLARKNANGQAIKQQFGPWMMRAFKVLTRLKWLRATPFDIFGRSDERRAERQLVVDYLALLGEFGQTLTEHNHATAIALATLPDDIRGFGHVKAKNMAAVAQRRLTLLERYRSTSPLKKAA